MRPERRCREGRRPGELTGELGAAPYRIVVPASWNGTLLVHAHGYRDTADGPGEVDDRNAPATPNAALEPVLLAQGYALAGSAYADNGWAVKEGIQATRALVSYFAEPHPHLRAVARRQGVPRPPGRRRRRLGRADERAPLRGLALRAQLPPELRRVQREDQASAAGTAHPDRHARPAGARGSYARTVADAGRSELLAQAYTSGEGHCNFTGPRLLAAVAALDGWVATGTAPTSASFPAALGFLPGFAPTPWPFE